MGAECLVRPLFSGPLDVVGDVHGEIEALCQLLSHLGYNEFGSHPAGRRLVFVGDLTDRGPDSPAVIKLLARWIEEGTAQCILGNHELNLLLGKLKHGNAWFFGREEALDSSGRVVPQAPADEAMRKLTLDLFRRLPLALERDDLRVVHACWEPGMVDQVRHATDVLQVYQEHAGRIRARLQQDPPADKTAERLALQNHNPVKVLTSGFEERAKEPFYASGRVRDEARVPWWNSYQGPTCVFGHYSRTVLPLATRGDNPFGDVPRYGWLGDGRAMCIDYSVAVRWKERQTEGFDGKYLTRLAALQWPQRCLVLDTGERIPMHPGECGISA